MFRWSSGSGFRGLSEDLAKVSSVAPAGLRLTGLAARPAGDGLASPRSVASAREPAAPWPSPAGGHLPR